MKGAALPSPLQRLDWGPLKGVELWVKRDDLIHPIVSGNKWRKLKGLFSSAVTQAQQESGESPMVVSFGGAYSHHLPALAACLAERGWRGLFVVRGEELSAEANKGLRYCAARGVRLMFVTRARYRELRAQGWALSVEEREAWGVSADALILPEGGDAGSAREGCAELWRELWRQWRALPEVSGVRRPLDELWLCAGTGATARGLLSEMPRACDTKVRVISAVRGAHREERMTRAIAAERALKLEWVDELRYGGFGKGSAELTRLRVDFIEETGLWLDQVYQPKLLRELIERWSELKGKRVVWLHTGGARALCEEP